jgi:hypothetical protein
VSTTRKRNMETLLQNNPPLYMAMQQRERNVSFEVRERVVTEWESSSG